MAIKSDSSSIWNRVDWAMVLPVLGLLSMGTVAIFSATSPMANYSQILQRHFFALTLGVAAFLLGISLNYQIFQDQSQVLYGLALAMMVCVLVFGETIRGHKAWFRLPFFSFQPSELVKVWLILVLSNYMDRRRTRMEGLGNLLGAAAMVLPVIALIIKEPDFSSALVLCLVVFSLLFIGGTNILHLLMLTGYAIVVTALVFVWIFLSLHPELVEASHFAAYLVSISKFNTAFLLTLVGLLAFFYISWRLGEWMRLNLSWLYFAIPFCIIIAGLFSGAFINRHIKEYQRQRFMAFMDPERDPQGATYHVNQALVAIGSGGFWGKGIFSGTQSQLGFLPERHTDFIFAVIGEEMGFVGSMVLLGLYILLLSRIIRAAELSRDLYGYLVCSGIAAMFGFYLLVNVGMCLGTLPVAGIPLPFVSYGGSNLVVNLWALGVVGNIYSKRYAFF